MLDELPIIMRRRGASDRNSGEGLVIKHLSEIVSAMNDQIPPTPLDRERSMGQ
jgi:hypothetical protein